MIQTDDFRKAIEQLAEYETNPISRFRVRRALRNERVMRRWGQRINRFMEEKNPSFFASMAPATFDFQSLLDWLMENWDEILKILLTIIPFFI